MLSFSYILRIYEAPYYKHLKPTDENYRLMDSYFTNLWVTIITVTTVGYGDISAVTFPGKLVTIAMAISGTFIMALVVSVVSSAFELDS